MVENIIQIMDLTRYAGPAYKYILQHLNVGVTGIQIWEGYDSRYHHPNRSLTWSMWGIFAVNDTTASRMFIPIGPILRISTAF